MTSNFFEIPILITSSIISSAPLTTVSSAEGRLRATLDGLRQMAKYNANHKLVICDGSNYDLSEHAAPFIHAFQNVEFLKFRNDVEKVKIYGKGYGEGEIVNYALEKSEILRDSKIFAKCTSKLWIENADACFRAFDGVAAFNIAPFFNPDKVDTRFYIVDKEFYRAQLSAAHLSVRDMDGYHLEHAFFDVISKNNYKALICSVAPLISGLSGSVGTNFKPDRLKGVAKNVRNNLIKIGILKLNNN